MIDGTLSLNVRAERTTYDGRDALRLVEERIGEGGLPSCRIPIAATA